MKVISLFAGAGGLDYGLERAGFPTSVAVEMDADCCRTLAKNRPDLKVIERDIARVKGDEILALLGCAKGEVDFLTGGPPCQPFSKAGQQRTGDTPRLSDPRAATIRHYLRLVEQTLPRVILMENVDAFMAEGRDEGLKLVESGLQAINRRTGSKYVPSSSVMNAAEFGVPQMRKRMFLVASRDGTEYHAPCPTHSEGGVGGLPPWRTAWDALGDLPPANEQTLKPGGKWARLLPCVPEGWNYLWHAKGGEGPEIFGRGTRFWNFLLKLAKAKPSWTITASVGPGIGPFHWDSRCLSIREAMRLQTFPDDVEIVGDYRSAMRQVGNAVPSLLGEVLGRHISAIFFDQVTSGPLTLLPPVRSPVPPPETPAELPDEYRSLVGDHAEHPGAGKGPGAVRRKKEEAEAKPAKVAKKPAPKAKRGKSAEYASMPGRAARRLVAFEIALHGGHSLDDGRTKPHIPTEAFRQACLVEGVYDRANFAQDMTKDVRLFRPVHDRKGVRLGWSLTKEGRQEAAEALGALKPAKRKAKAKARA